MVYNISIYLSIYLSIFQNMFHPICNVNPGCIKDDNRGTTLICYKNFPFFLSCSGILTVTTKACVT